MRSVRVAVGIVTAALLVWGTAAAIEYNPPVSDVCWSTALYTCPRS